MEEVNDTVGCCYASILQAAYDSGYGIFVVEWDSGKR